MVFDCEIKDGTTFGPMQIKWQHIVVLVFQFKLLHGNETKMGSFNKISIAMCVDIYKCVCVCLELKTPTS